MDSPISPVLRQLYDLDNSSPDFHDQLRSILDGLTLQGGDSAWLVNYLDEVRLGIALPSSAQAGAGT